jgi:hypothetical protein
VGGGGFDNYSSGSGVTASFELKVRVVIRVFQVILDIIHFGLSILCVLARSLSAR